ncbi:hypothetical protein [Aliterella atlantica]|uniref:Cyanovirin-N domain-containing protein n=1 Tax=Aliterella atlantica CENA595 TaxID=1618023 RepID=A0A0D8ZLL1_9CYAN|nr:hypothetical protein [Aliterella atlantica]KJH69630.1 hypothetical protein UH38_22630 [Aliterella atlantica CENA595]
MKAAKLLVTSLFAFSFIGISPQTVKAALSCEMDTAINYANGSLASCILNFDVNIGLSNNHFVCQQKQYISFDEKGQFRSCTLARDLLLRKGNKITTCLAKGEVSVKILNSGNQEITCSRMVANQ